MTYEIEDGVPIPLPSRGGRDLGITAAIRSLKPGQSVVIDRGMMNLSSTVFHVRRATGYTYVMRKIDDTHTRIWRIALGSEGTGA